MSPGRRRAPAATTVAAEAVSAQEARCASPMPASWIARRGRQIGLFLVLSGVVLALHPPAAGAAIVGPCASSVYGEDIAHRGTAPTSAAIVIDRYTNFAVKIAAQRPLAHLQVSLQVAGERWSVDNVRFTPRRSAEVHLLLAPRGRYGVGLYELVVAAS